MEGGKHNNISTRTSNTANATCRHGCGSYLGGNGGKMERPKCVRKFMCNCSNSL